MTEEIKTKRKIIEIIAVNDFAPKVLMRCKATFNQGVSNAIENYQASQIIGSEVCIKGKEVVVFDIDDLLKQFIDNIMVIVENENITLKTIEKK